MYKNLQISLSRSTASRIVRHYNMVSLLTALVGFWLPVIIFAKIAGEVIERQPVGIDVRMLYAIHGHATPLLDSIFIGITNCGSAEVIAPMTILLAAYLIYKKYKRQAVILLFGVGGAAAANIVLKALFHRERPSLWSSLVTEQSFSFPSGHAMVSSAFALCIVMLLWQTKWRWLSVLIAVPLVIVIGFSRLYLGVHYPTDIIAGWAVSIAWVVIVSSLVSDFPFKLRTRVAVFRSK